MRLELENSNNKPLIKGALYNIETSYNKIYGFYDKIYGFYDKKIYKFGGGDFYIFQDALILNKEDDIMFFDKEYYLVVKYKLIFNISIFEEYQNLLEEHRNLKLLNKIL